MEIEVENLQNINVMPDLNKQRLLGQFCDVQIFAMDGTRFYAHLGVLAVRCEYFQQVVPKSWKEARLKKIELEGSREVVEQILNYIYIGKVRVGEAKSVDLLKVADRYGLVKLFDTIGQHIADNIDRDNVVDVAVAARLLNSNFLREKAMKFLVDKFVHVPRTEEIEDDEMTEIMEKCNQEDTDIMAKIFTWFKTNKKPDILLRLVQGLELQRVSGKSLRLVLEACLENDTCHRLLSEKLMDGLGNPVNRSLAKGNEYRVSRISTFIISSLGASLKIQWNSRNEIASDFVRSSPEGTLVLGGKDYTKLGGAILVIYKNGQHIQYTLFDFSSGIHLRLPVPSKLARVELCMLLGTVSCVGSALKVGKMGQISRFKTKNKPATASFVVDRKFKVTQGSNILRLENTDISLAGSEQCAVFLFEGIEVRLEDRLLMLKEFDFSQMDNGVEIEFPFEDLKPYSICIYKLE